MHIETHDALVILWAMLMYSYFINFELMRTYYRKSNPNITQWMRENGMATYKDVEAYYIKRLMEIVAKYNAKCIIWQDPIDNDIPVHFHSIHVYMLNNGICIPQRTIRIIISVVRKLISTQLYTLLRLVLYSRTLRVATKELTYYESSVGEKKITAIITVHST